MLHPKVMTQLVSKNVREVAAKDPGPARVGANFSKPPTEQVFGITYTFRP